MHFDANYFFLGYTCELIWKFSLRGMHSVYNEVCVNGFYVVHYFVTQHVLMHAAADSTAMK